MNFFGVLDFFVLIQSCLGAKILLIGETNDTQLMDLFQESKSNNFEIISIEVDHDQEDAAQNTSFCGYIGKQVINSIGCIVNPPNSPSGLTNSRFHIDFLKVLNSRI